MGCCGERENFGNIKNEQKWDYINLDDFHSQSCVTPLSYGFLWFLLIVSVGVYAVDLYTACNLLFFDRWSGQVQPAIPFSVSRWIFAGCIILSWVLLVYRAWRAYRAIKSGSITKSYLDPLAVRIQSIRTGGRGRGWHRFLVFAALTKGRKGAEYVALFTYFTFEAWMRIVFAEGPRQVINALTLYSVLTAKLIPTGAHKPTAGQSPIAQFFANVSILASQDKEQATVLFGMLYTLIIWIFSALSLILAVLFYVLFLWHHIPSADGGLSKYCQRKIERRLHKIVMETVNKALAKGDKRRAANDLAKPGFAGTAINEVKRQPTLPDLDGRTITGTMPPLSRQTTQSDFSPFPARAESPFPQRPESPFSARPDSRTASRSDIQRVPTIPDLDSNQRRPGLPSRQTTQSSARSNISYASDAPLLSQAGNMGFGGQARSGLPLRTDSSQSFQSQHPPLPKLPSKVGGVPRSQSPHMAPPRRQFTDQSVTRSSSAHTIQSYNWHPMDREPSFTSYRLPNAGNSNTNQRHLQEYEMQPPRTGSAMSNKSVPTQQQPGPHEYVAFKPHNSGPSSGPVRNFTMPFSSCPLEASTFSRPDLPERSGTAPLPFSSSRPNATPDAHAYHTRPGFPTIRPYTADPGKFYHDPRHGLGGEIYELGGGVSPR